MSAPEQLKQCAELYQLIGKRIAAIEDFSCDVIEDLIQAQDQIEAITASIAQAEPSSASKWLTSVEDDNSLSPEQFLELSRLKKQQRKITDA